MENARWKELLTRDLGGKTIDTLLERAGSPALSFTIGATVGAVDAAIGTYPMWTVCLGAWDGMKLIGATPFPEKDARIQYCINLACYGVGGSIPFLLNYFS